MKRGGTRYVVHFVEKAPQDALGFNANSLHVTAAQIEEADGGLWVQRARRWVLYPWHKIDRVEAAD